MQRWKIAGKFVAVLLCRRWKSAWRRERTRRHAVVSVTHSHTHMSHHPIHFFDTKRREYGCNMADESFKVRVEERLKIKIGKYGCGDLFVSVRFWDYCGAFVSDITSRGAMTFWGSVSGRRRWCDFCDFSGCGWVVFSVFLCVAGEAKNLQARSHGSPIHRDVYCTLSLDQEEIFRTSTIEKTLRWVSERSLFGLSVSSRLFRFSCTD